MKEVNRRKFFQASGAAVACAALPAVALGHVTIGRNAEAKIDRLVDAAFVDMHVKIDGMHVAGCRFTRCQFEGEFASLKDCTFDHCDHVFVQDGGPIDNCTFIHERGRFVVQAL